MYEFREISYHNISFNEFYAQDNYKNSVEFEKLAVNNYLNKNYGLFLDNMKKAYEFRPNYPRLIYNLAASYSLNNYKKDAFAELQKLINMKLYYLVKNDSDFIAFRDDADFKNIISKFRKILAPEGNSKTAFVYPEKDLVTESVAYDSLQNKFY